MKAEQFIKSLLPDFDKERINEDYRITKEELERYTLPAFQKAVPFIKDWEFRNERVLKMMVLFKTNVKSNKGNFIEAIYEGLKSLPGNIDTVKEVVDNSFGDGVVSQGLTYYKSQLLQYMEAANFVTRYARRLLNFVYVAEASMFESQETIENAITPADAQWVENNFFTFCTAFKAVTGKQSDVKAALANVPDILIQEGNQNNLEQTVGNKKLDPLELGFIPLALNPIFHVRMAIASWQINRYHAAKQEIKCLQLRQEHLRSLSQNKPNASTEKQIANLESRIQNLLKANAEMEQRYA